MHFLQVCWRGLVLLTQYLEEASTMAQETIQTFHTGSILYYIINVNTFIGRL